MIHILFSKKKNKKTKKCETYFVEVNDRNGKIIGDSGETHPSKQRTISNIISKMAVYNSLRVTVVDHTASYEHGRVRVFDIVKKITRLGKPSLIRYVIDEDNASNGGQKSHG